MNEDRQDMPSDGERNAPSAKSSGRGRWDVVLIVVAVLVGLCGAFASRLLWPHNDSPPPADQREVAPEPVPPASIDAPSPPSAPPQPADDADRTETPLPTTPAALLEEVAQVIEQLVASFPGNVDCLEMKARYQKWTGKTEEAVKTWQHCLDLAPDYAHAYLGMAEVAAKKGDHAKAADLARKSMAAGPRLFQARAVLCDALMNLGQPQEVIDLMEEYLPSDPRSYGYFLLGRAYALTKQPEKAKENYEASIRKYPDYAEAYYGLSRICVQLDKKEAARKSMTRYRELMAERHPGRQGMDMTPESFEELCDDAAIIYTDAGRIYFADNQAEEAERLLRRAAGLSPENIECRRALAWLSRSKVDATETIQWLTELAALDPTDSSPWLEIGNLQLDLLQLEAAEEAYQKACHIAPEDPRGHAALATLYLRSGQKNSEALTLARKAVELAPTAANYSLLATACERNGDAVGAAEAKTLATKQDSPSGEN